MTMGGDHKMQSQANSAIAGAADGWGLSDLVRFIANSPDVPERQRPYLVSALNRTRALLGAGALDIKADPRAVLGRLDSLSPAMVGLKPQSLANLTYRVRLSIRLAAPHFASARSLVPLSGEWEALNRLLAVRESRRMSRFLRFAQASGSKPTDIGDEHLERFHTYFVTTYYSIAPPRSQGRRRWHGIGP